MYKLLSATPSPYARKVRIVLAEKAIPFELITEVPWNSTTMTPKFNPLEKLPVLLLDDGSSVYESHFILEYLERKHPAPPMLPADDDGILAAKRLEVLCDGICDALVSIFMERRRPVEHQSKAWMDRQRRKVDGGIRETACLVGAREWAVGDRFGLGDVATVTVTGYLSVRFPEVDWRVPYPDLAAYCDRLGRRPSIGSTLPYPQDITDKVV